MTRTALLDRADMPDTTGLISPDEAMEIAEELSEITANERGGQFNWIAGDKAIRLVGPHTGKDTKQQRDLLRWLADVSQLDEIVRRFADDEREDVGFDALKDYRRVSTAYPPKFRADIALVAPMPYVCYRYVAGKDDRLDKIERYARVCNAYNRRPSLRNFLEWRNAQGENVKELSESSANNYVKQTALNLERMSTEQKAALVATVISEDIEVARALQDKKSTARSNLAQASLEAARRSEAVKRADHETDAGHRKLDSDDGLVDLLQATAHYLEAQNTFNRDARDAMALAGTVNTHDPRVILLLETLGQSDLRDLAVTDTKREVTQFAKTGKGSLDSFLSGVLNP